MKKYRITLIIFKLKYTASFSLIIFNFFPGNMGTQWQVHAICWNIGMFPIYHLGSKFETCKVSSLKVQGKLLNTGRWTVWCWISANFTLKLENNKLWATQTLVGRLKIWIYLALRGSKSWPRGGAAHLAGYSTVVGTISCPNNHIEVVEQYIPLSHQPCKSYLSTKNGKEFFTTLKVSVCAYYLSEITPKGMFGTIVPELI